MSDEDLTRRNRYTCAEDGCGRYAGDGYAIYRTSLKGQLFAGKCELHFPGVAEPIAQAIENRNHG
jgi:hypothetical protein